MSDLFRPFVRGWEYADRHWGFPGQVFICVAAVMLVLGVMTWVGNRR